MARLTVLFDACVLYPAPLRDLLMRVAIADLFSARWTDRIHDEWIRNVQNNRPDLTRDQLERTRRLMNSHVHDSLVTHYESLIDGLSLPDPDDRHVLAAAIRSRASVIVTFNLRDFPSAVLAPLDIEAQHPDVFLANLLHLAPGIVCEAVKRQREALQYPPRSVEELLVTLEQQQLPETVAILRQFGGLL